MHTDMTCTSASRQTSAQQHGHNETVTAPLSQNTYIQQKHAAPPIISTAKQQHDHNFTNLTPSLTVFRLSSKEQQIATHVHTRARARNPAGNTKNVCPYPRPPTIRNWWTLLKKVSVQLGSCYVLRNLQQRPFISPPPRFLATVVR